MSYLIVWHRGPFAGSAPGTGLAAAAGSDPAKLAIPLPALHAPALHAPALHAPALHAPALHAPALHGSGVAPEVLYPRVGQPPVSWDADRSELTVTLPETPAACLVRMARPGP